MEIIGKIIDIVPTLDRKIRATIEINGTDAAEELGGLALPPPGGTAPPPLRIRLTKARKQRSLDANAYFWSMVGQIQAVTGQSKDQIYHMLLRRYGVYTYLVVKSDAVDRLRMVWRDIEILGDTTTETGARGKSVLAFFGSSTYDTKEMSTLISGTADEVRALGLTPPPTRDMQTAIENWKKNHNNNNEINRGVEK